MKGPAAAESLRGWVVWARGSRRQRLDLRDDSSAAMPHSTVCTDCVQWGKVEYLQSWFKHNTTLILPPSSVHCVFLLQCNGNCSCVCGFANTKRVESNSRIWEFFPSGVPTNWRKESRHIGKHHFVFMFADFLHFLRLLLCVWM